MEDSRTSDISKTTLDLVDLSTNENDASAPPAVDDDSLHPTGTRGFCVKEYEEQMQLLKKENFNLKLRLYFLEEKNPNIPEGAETLYKQNIDLKVEVDSLEKGVQEKQDLLCQASKALELLDVQKSNDLKHSQMKIDELNQKVESLEHEVSSLQDALSNANKPNLGNDTGYADFLGAIDNRDIELQRKMVEIRDVEKKFLEQISDMNVKVKELQDQKKVIEERASNLDYDNSEMKDKLSQVEATMTQQHKKFAYLRDYCHEKLEEFRMMKFKTEDMKNVCELRFYDEEKLKSELERELREFKDKWAATTCELNDSEEKFKESETQRRKTLVALKDALHALDEERHKVIALEEQINNSTHEADKNNTMKELSEQELMLKSKNNEIGKLKDELNDMKRRLFVMTNKELHEKNEEISKLTNVINNMKAENNHSQLSRLSLEQLTDSFNDLKIQQSIEQKNNAQRKIDELLNQIADATNNKHVENVMKLKEQMAIVVEKQEVSDSALEKCVEICSFSLDHLNGLAQFMSNLLQQKEFCESLSEATMNNMQCVINKTFELSNHAARFSISIDGCRMSSLPNISSLDLLMATARNSLGSIRDLCGHNKSFHDAKNEQIETMEVEMGKIKEDLLTARSEIDKLNQHNVILQEQVKESKIQYERLNSGRNQLIEDIRNELKKVETENELLTTQMNEAKDIIDDLVDERDELESNLTIETGKRTDLEIQLEKGEKLISQLQEKIDIIENDLLLNWITRDEHKQVEKRLKEEIVNGEAQLAAVRMEMESLRNDIKIHVEEKKAEEVANKENVKEQQKRRTIEISDDRRLMLMNEAADSLDEISNPSEPSSCQMCTKYQSKIIELKKYLSRAIEKIKMQSEIKAQNDRHIQKQLSNTESFLHSARANMENILKSRNVPQE